MKILQWETLTYLSVFKVSVKNIHKNIWCLKSIYRGHFPALTIKIFQWERDKTHVLYQNSQL